jgi:hypothetical protein
MSLNDEFKTVHEFMKIMPYVAPMREILNIDPSELNSLRYYLILYIFISFLSLSLLFILNNFHIFLFYYENQWSNFYKDAENKSPVLLKTLSVLDYVNNYDDKDKSTFA